MKKIIKYCLLFSIFFLVNESAFAEVFTKYNTQSMRSFSSIGDNLNTSRRAAYCGEQIHFSPSTLTRFCKGEINSIKNTSRARLGKGHIGCNARILYNSLAWCVANDVVEKVTLSNFPYTLGKPQKYGKKGYCKWSRYVRKYRRKSNRGPICMYTIYQKPSNPSYRGSVKNKRDNVSITLSGTKHSLPTSNKTFRIRNNSPFLYFENQPRGDISVEIDSKYELVKTSTPTFTKGSGWDIKSDGNSISVAGKKQDHLFYELGIQTVELSRNGRNFSSKQELLSYLKMSDFFDKLGFSQIEKENSLNYIVPKIETSENYYLTLLDEASIKNISTLDIEPTPEQLLRKYFIIYPTKHLVKITGDIVFPENIEEEKQQYTVKDYGEIYVDNTMVVLWK